MSKWLDVSLTCTQLSFKTKQAPSYSPMNSIYEQDGHKLYLGNILAANDQQYLKSHQVGAVLSVIDTSDIQLEKSIIHLWIAAEDCEKVQLIKYFDQASNFIRDNLKHTNVLVHCYAGISRSSSLIIAYLMKYQGYTLNEALIKTKCQRPQVDPNDGFMEQLKQYENRLKQPTSNSRSPTAKTKFLSTSASAEKSQKSIGRNSISNFNIYSNYKINTNINNNNNNNVETIKTKTHIQNLQLKTITIPKQKSSFLDKSSPKNTSLSTSKSKTFFTNSIEDPVTQYQKIKSTEQVYNKHILGLKNIYGTHQRQHSTNF